MSRLRRRMGHVQTDDEGHWVEWMSKSRMQEDKRIDITNSPGVFAPEVGNRELLQSPFQYVNVSCQLTQSEGRSARFLHPLSHSSSWQYWEGWSHGDGRDQAYSNWLVTYLRVFSWATYLSTLIIDELSRCCVWTTWVSSSSFSLSAIPSDFRRVSDVWHR